MSPKGSAWTYSEIDIIINNAETLPVTELAMLLPGRSVKSIERKIEKLRLDGRIGYKSLTYKDREPVRRGDGWNDNWDDKWK